MKIAISGSNGFIGRNLTELLKEQHHTVTPINRVLFADYDKLEDFFITLKPDIILHLAAYGNHHNQELVDVMVASNIFFTYLLLKASLSIPYKALLTVGSSSEYGLKHTAMKESQILKPQTFYGATKAAATQLAHAFAIRYNKPIATIRPFSVYGEGEASFRFIPTVIKALQYDKPIKLVSGLHDWIYITDFIEGLLQVVNHIEEVKGEVVNIGTGKQYENKTVVALLEEISGKKLKIINDNKIRVYDSPVWKADNSQLKKLGWRQHTSLEKGLRHTYEYYKQLKTAHS